MEKPAPSSTEAPKAQVSENYIYRPAIVETARAEMYSTKPPQAQLTINGLLHDGATNLHEIKTTRVTGGFSVNVTTSRARDAIASLAIVPYERNVILDLTGIPSGPCSIQVNGVSTTLYVP